MDKEKQSPLAKAVFCAINGLGANVSDDMKYCVVVNVGSVPLQKEDRAQVLFLNHNFSLRLGYRVSQKVVWMIIALLRLLPML